MKEYRCSECMNRRTPLCELCNSVKSPDGEESKPTYYQGVSGITTECPELEALVNTIAMRALACVPINLNSVMRYNKLVAGEEE